jgi:hypothetical protein
LTHIEGGVMANSNGAAAGGAGAVYGLGFFGAVVWNWQVADSFWGYPWGFIESLFWPGFFVYEMFQLAG